MRSRPNLAPARSPDFDDPIRPNHEVFGLDVAVNDAPRMCRAARARAICSPYAAPGPRQGDPHNWRSDVPSISSITIASLDDAWITS